MKAFSSRLKDLRVQTLSADGLRTASLRNRRSKVSVRDFAKISHARSDVGDLIRNLPDLLAGKNLKEFLSLMRRAKRQRKPVLFGLGAHVIKVGLNPVLIDLMKGGWITGLALNGAGIIHDFEIAFSGRTSEDVGPAVKEGRFGMARETGEILNRTIRAGAAEGIGLGEAVGRMIAGSDFPYRNLSLLGSAFRLGVPATVHVAIGTDFIHFHPAADGGALGQTSLADFFVFCSLVKRMDGGGIYINAGSAVVLPEVFLKAVAFVRNKGGRLSDFSTAVFDFIYHYRPSENVVRRPLGTKGKGFYFLGHHEILIPLLAAALKIPER